MATPDQIPTDLTLDIGDDLAPDAFLSAVKHFVGYVDEITKAQSGDGSQVTWTIKVRQGSNLIGVQPSSSASTSRLAMIYNVASHAPRAVARGDIAGAGVTEKALAHLKALSDIAKKSLTSHVNIWVRRDPVAIGARISEIVEEDARASYQDYGSLEGRLEAIQDVSGGLKIRVKDYLYPRAINCKVPERLIERVMAGFRRRVELHGNIHFRLEGTPISIDVDDIDLLPEDDDLPTPGQVRGLLTSA